MLCAMSAIAERIELRLRELPPRQAETLERVIASLLDMFESEASPAKPPASSGVEALAALNRIAGRGGIAGIDDATTWQRELRSDRILPGRDQDP